MLSKTLRFGKLAKSLFDLQSCATSVSHSFSAASVNHCYHWFSEPPFSLVQDRTAAKQNRPQFQRLCCEEKFHKSSENMKESPFDDQTQNCICIHIAFVELLLPILQIYVNHKMKMFFLKLFPSQVHMSAEKKSAEEI